MQKKFSSVSRIEPMRRHPENSEAPELVRFVLDRAVTIYLLALTMGLGFCTSGVGAAQHGNYLPSRVGEPRNTKSEGLISFPDREWMYDFDTSAPLRGIEAGGATLTVSGEFFMTRPHALQWMASKGEILTFDANLPLRGLGLSVGVFQKNRVEGATPRSLRIACFADDGNRILSKTIYLHRLGWNIASMELPSSAKKVSKVTIEMLGGAHGMLLLDNVMLRQNGRSLSTEHIGMAKLPDESADNYPLTPLTDSERKAFAVIAEHMGKPEPARISDTKMAEFRAYYDSWDIEIKGGFANGKIPISFTSYMFDRNKALCYKMREFGEAYARAEGAQRKELGDMIVGLTTLAVTYGCMPNDWYNGRGFADCVFYARDALERAGILDRTSQLLFQQYGLDEILCSEHDIEKPPSDERAVIHAGRPCLAWRATADCLNTNPRRIMSILLAMKETPEKSRAFRRLKSWLDCIALNYAPGNDDALKPDGSWFHHWGNRFDNYGWNAAWRGATEYVYWLSGTPFAVSSATRERMAHMADIHFKVMSKSGYVGGLDFFHRVSVDGFLNLARAGTPDGSSEIDPVAASYWLAHIDETDDKPFVIDFTKRGIKPAARTNNVTLSYAGINVHNHDPWQIYTHGLSRFAYYTQYRRPGWLFYNIGGLSVTHDGKATGLLATHGQNMKHGNNHLTPGYNLSRAPAVTSIPAAFNLLEQLYYQRGSSMFVGGLSTRAGLGVFAQVFDGGNAPKYYKGSPADGLRFKKSYFYFGDTIACVASGIGSEKGTRALETGLLQEPASAGANALELSNGVLVKEPTKRLVSSDTVKWIYNRDMRRAVYLMSEQTLTIFRGDQTFGPSKGEIVSAYLNHQDRDWYEWLMVVDTDAHTLRRLEKAMSGPKPPITILRRDDHAHIVRCEKESATGYVIFKGSYLSEPGAVKTVDAPCVIMTRAHDGKLSVAVADPDLHIDFSKPKCSHWSRPAKKDITLRGVFSPVQELPGNVKLVQGNGHTKLAFTVKDGLTTEIVLAGPRAPARSKEEGDLGAIQIQSVD